MVQILKRTGNTVFYNASGLEEYFPDQRIFFKLEGTNPTGRIQDRLAAALVKEAKQLGFYTISVASLGPLGESIAYVSSTMDMKCIIYMPEKSFEKKKSWFHMEGVTIVEKGKTYNDSFQFSFADAKKNGWYNANPGYDNIGISNAVYGEIAEEIVKKTIVNPDNLFMFLGDGALALAMHNGFRVLWHKGIIDRIPKIHAVCTEKDNNIYKAFLEGSEDVKDAYSETIKGRKVNRSTFKYKITDAQGVLNAVYDSGGSIICADKNQIFRYSELIKKREHIKIKSRGCIAFQGFDILFNEGKIKPNSINVFLMEDGQPAIEVRELSNLSENEKESYIHIVMEFLAEYGDDYNCTKEAVENALKSGFVLGAYTGNKITGVCVIVKMPMSQVIPQYHLVYIGSDLNKGSRGIGTLLMKKAIELTEGDFSLHVDLKNNKAIRVYEKMGLAKSYVRMIYKK
ncbi:MAG: pyridoxal-phosphate dependent enzyme [Candidatus Muirbacterium halophilum]|nr:pyridoxal-phosphate dependent enzyme [Candidatus Muirbacterium halophilum]MCK9474547.1 pyridoxal-phosphate dependent enzyme [Candidatus Muirbacterium halophilum]